MPSARSLLGYVKPLYIYCFMVNLLGFCGNFVKRSISEGTWEKNLIFQIVGVLLFGYLASRIGRKKSLILAGIFIFISQITRDLGISGINLISPMYIGEVAEDHNRGVLVSCFILSLELGYVLYTGFIIFIIYASIHGFYYNVLYGAFLFGLVINVICLVLLFWLPEPPVYYLLNKKTDDAKTALVKLRGKDDEITDWEFNELILSVEKSNSNKNTIPFVSLTDSGFRKGLILGSVSMNATQLNKGIENVVDEISLLKYFGPLFSNPDVDRFVDYFIGLFPVSLIIVAMALIERSGRRFLLLVSCGGVVMIFIVYYLFSGLFLLVLKWDDDTFAKDSVSVISDIFPIVSYMMYYLGCRVVPWVLLSELFATNSRVSGITFCNLFVYIGDNIWEKINGRWFSDKDWEDNILVFHVYPSIFFIIAISCWFVVYYCLLETKGKSLEEISVTLARLS